MDRLGMTGNLSLGSGNGNGTKSNKQYQVSQHATEKGMKVTVPRPSGSKLAKKAFLGTCTLRNGVGAAGRLALEGKLCKK